MGRLAFDSKTLTELTGLNKNDITYLVKVNLLHPIRINNRYLFTRSDVERCLETLEGMEIKTKKTDATTSVQL